MLLLGDILFSSSKMGAYMQILYRDNQILVCIKPSGVLSEGESAEALPFILSEQMREENEKNTDIFPVHRLDRETEGVMVFARTKAAAAALSESIQRGEFRKIYLAYVHGVPEKESDTLEDYLYFDRRLCKSFIAARQRRGVKKASLDYKLLSEHDGISLLEIHLHTGRTHQIRVQLASRGLPLVGDRRYGAPRSELRSVALLARTLSFPHPKTKEKLTFSAALPKGWNIK